MLLYLIICDYITKGRILIFPQRQKGGRHLSRRRGAAALSPDGAIILINDNTRSSSNKQIDILLLLLLLLLLVIIILILLLLLLLPTTTTTTTTTTSNNNDNSNNTTMTTRARAPEGTQRRFCLSACGRKGMSESLDRLLRGSGFRGFDSSRLLILRGGNSSCPLNFIGSLPESLTQGLLVGKLLVGGLGVFAYLHCDNNNENDNSYNDTNIERENRDPLNKGKFDSMPLGVRERGEFSCALNFIGSLPEFYRVSGICITYVCV